MTHSENIYLEAKERMVNSKNTIVTEPFLMDVIQDLYPDNFLEHQALLESIHIPSLVEDVKEELQEQESYDRDPLAHVGMRTRDFI